MIKIDNLSYDYISRDENGKVLDVKPALKNVNLEIERGEFVAIVGRNGSGKSTLASLINALIMPTSGKVFVDGMDTSDEERLWDVRRTAGMVFQNPDNQIIATVVEEDIAFGPENIGVPSAEIRQRVDDALRTVGMEDFAKASPNRLSGGQKQRVAIAGVLALLPSCIIFDESTAMLDPEGRDEVMNVIEDLKSRGLTIILITHYMNEAAKADRVIVMDDGEVVMEGTPREIFADKESLKNHGLELPSAAYLAEKLRERGISLNSQVINAEELIKDVLSKR